MAETGVRPQCPECGTTMNASFKTAADEAGCKEDYTATWECPSCGQQLTRGTTKPEPLKTA